MAMLKMLAAAVAGFLLCVGAGYVLNRTQGAVWGGGVGVVYLLWLASLLNPRR